LNLPPPSDTSASVLWAKLQEMPRPSKLVEFPRKGVDGNPVGQLRIRVLTQEEQLICTDAAEKFAKARLKDGKRGEIGYEDLFSNAMCVEILYRACRDESNLDKAAFPSPKALQQQLTTDECDRLFAHYLTVQLELGPIIATMDEDTYNAWVERLAEAEGAYPLDLLSPDVLKRLAVTMAKQIMKYRTAASSVGSSPEEDTKSG